MKPNTPDGEKSVPGQMTHDIVPAPLHGPHDCLDPLFGQARHVSDYASVYDPETDFDAWLTRFVGRRIAARLRADDTVLEIGCATGLMTEILAPRCAHVLGIERSADYVARFARRGIANAEAIVADGEDWADTRRFRHIVATGMLGNLKRPETFLVQCRQRLAAADELHLSVANPRSLHRLAAAEMGLIKDVRDASPVNHVLGNRNFETGEVIAMAAAGLVCVHREGVLVKPLPNAMMAQLPPDVIEAMDRIAHFVPEFCAVTYFVFVAG